ncbi:hypothetical protein KY285_033647 [Solanum tuberosum]|nr:hypothetical protein KY285_033647 [Solanum tuberosum]
MPRALASYGDYNIVASINDRLVGSPVLEVEMADFKEHLHDTGTVDLKQVGRNFTWTNSRVNSDWMHHMTHMEVMVMDPGVSDHSPLSVVFQEQRCRSTKSFKFLNCLAEHKEFIPLVVEAWRCNTQKRGMHGVWMRLKSIKQRLKELNTKEFRNVAEKIKTARTCIAELQESMRTDHQDVAFAHEKALRGELEKWNLVEESILKQKSRNRVAQNSINKMVSLSGTMLQKQEEIEKEVTLFYRGLLGTAATQISAINPTTIKEGTILHREHQLRLIQPVTKEEIHDILWAIWDNKAPGCDGMNAYFLRRLGKL